MLPFAVLGLILWILLLLWRTNTKTVAMPEKGEESPSGCGPSAAQEDMPAPHSLRPGKHSLSTVPTTSAHNEDNGPQANCASAGLEVKTADNEVQQASSEVNSEQIPPPPITQKPSKTKVPMLSSGPEARERLKFILGASEDNSSDEEPLVTKPPSGASQPPTSTPKSSPLQVSSAVPQPSSSSIK